ncbi:uncharacterized protein ACBR49_012398 [Aulostomus maculatus]
MAQRMFQESGQDGRSVLGMLSVQVERDPKTGATIIRSVAPVSTPADAPVANTVFDDGRRSIHTVGGLGDEPSTEELGQILSVIDGVGMKVLLDEVTVTPNQAEMENIEVYRVPEEKDQSFSACHAMSKENAQLHSSRNDDLKAQLEIGNGGGSVDIEDGNNPDGNMMMMRDTAGKEVNIENHNLEEGPVTLLFLGYAEATTSPGGECQEDMIPVERVIITEDGEEHVLGPQSTVDNVADQKSQQEVFQNIPLDGNGAGVQVQGDQGDKELHSSSVTTEEAAGASKRKTCQCCSVM